MNQETRCGVLSVPENPAGGSRSIDLNILMVPAISEHGPDDPLFFLAGGPGQAATEVAPVVLDALSEVHRSRDLVFVDQRGTGESNPLKCPIPEQTLAETYSATLPGVGDCLEQLEGDLTQYHTANFVDDLDRVRQHLGYEQINLLGGSYGTRAALVYARRHAPHLRSMILDGVVPPQTALFLHFGEDAQAALDSTFERCESDGFCNDAYPNLRGGFLTLMEALPQQAQVTDPHSGQREQMEVTTDTVAGLVRAILYQPTLASLLPMALTEAGDGDFDTLLTLGHTATGSVSDSMHTGLMLSVVCSEDVPRITDEEVASVGTSFLGSLLVDVMRDTCTDWPRASLPPDAFEAVQSDAPTLLLSGGLDPVTPRRWAELAAETLPQAQQAVAPGAGHGVFSNGCGPRLIAEFLDGDSIDPSCLSEVTAPPFFIDFAGPMP